MFFRLGALSQELLLNLFPNLFFVDHEVAVRTPTHKAQKRIYADGKDISHRLLGHGHDTRTAQDSDAPFQMAQGDMFVAWRAREMYYHITPREMRIKLFESTDFLGLANRCPAGTPFSGKALWVVIVPLLHGN